MTLGVVWMSEPSGFVAVGMGKCERGVGRSPNRWVVNSVIACVPWVNTSDLSTPSPA